jgi:hypothetical protein
MKKNIENGKLINAKSKETGVLFDHFTTNSWTFESLFVEEILKMMTEEEKQDFIIDPKAIDWSFAI